MRRVSTLEDLVSATMECLTVVSSHAQYLADREDLPADCRKDVEIIVDEAGLIAGCLALVPSGLATTVILAHADNPEAAQPGGGR